MVSITTDKTLSNTSSGVELGAARAKLPANIEKTSVKAKIGRNFGRYFFIFALSKLMLPPDLYLIILMKNLKISNKKNV